MKSVDVDKIIAGHSHNHQASHPGHRRHHAAPHHWSSVIVLSVTALGLLVLLVVVDNHSRTPTFQPSSLSVASQATTALTGVTNDLASVNPDDLANSQIGQ